ncbi:uncharacterized protein LOC129762388 [Toxorhynchites rutilus septentrionalis]|uniref:uncharacterized protein LOC129762388 n=1 Tax=Toxorhynchites rutilus septentrionalis TaxID=329112 RepID=UPI002479FD9F|nr:uncharacterized protein LOC129762388 [Toxorhynchites rutilus septentrionalis]
MILTINGTVIPEAINFGFLRASIRNFYPNPMQCFGCFAFGHTSKKCAKKIQLCRNCGVAHPELNTNSNDKDKIKNFICNAPASCVNCKGNHASTSRKCPAWIAEDNITRVRIDQGVSYKEAKSIFENKNGPSFASKLQERLVKIQNTGCSQCKCNCNQAKQTSSEKAVPIPSSNPQESELSTSSSDSEISMEIETTPSNKRKNTNKRSTSDEFKSSEEEIFRGKESNRKKSKNQKYNSTQPANESKPSTSFQPSTSPQPSTSFQPTTASKTKTSNHSNKPTPPGNKSIAKVSKNDPRLKNKSSKSTHS